MYIDYRRAPELLYKLDYDKRFAMSNGGTELWKRGGEGATQANH